jgi:hypothetical protein
MLKVLHFTVRSGYKDGSYLDATRWEQLILQDLPQLKEFEFEYYQYASDNEVKRSYDEHNRFTSAFWLQRQWIYEVMIDDEQFIYSINPYKYIEIKFLDKKINLSILEKNGMNIYNRELDILLLNLLNEDERCLAHVSKTNKITEVYLEQMNYFKELNFLLGLCCYINSLQNINI